MKNVPLLICLLTAIVGAAQSVAQDSSTFHPASCAATIEAYRDLVYLNSQGLGQINDDYTPIVLCPVMRDNTTTIDWQYLRIYLYDLSSSYNFTCGAWLLEASSGDVIWDSTTTIAVYCAFPLRISGPSSWILGYKFSE